jgi:hypothetical protein
MTQLLEGVGGCRAVDFHKKTTHPAPPTSNFTGKLDENVPNLAKLPQLPADLPQASFPSSELHDIRQKGQLKNGY